MFGGNIHLFLELLEGNDSHFLSAMEFQLRKNHPFLSGHPWASLVVLVPGTRGGARARRPGLPCQKTIRLHSSDHSSESQPFFQVWLATCCTFQEIQNQIKSRNSSISAANFLVYPVSGMGKIWSDHRETCIYIYIHITQGLTKQKYNQAGPSQTTQNTCKKTWIDPDVERKRWNSTANATYYGFIPGSTGNMAQPMIFCDILTQLLLF